MGEYPKITPNILISLSVSILYKGVAGTIWCFSLKELDPVPIFKLLVASECEPALRENRLWVPFLASRALKGPDEAALIYCLKILDMATFERWGRLEKLSGQ
ncbi:hypothetical protein OIU85_014114 [Salix viminalis]|uniref:Uncharacterized protein n=1 Tax=Salix viminalis TaxID=40686 RepID=A0A9Q0NNE9_SALVM|nr:hypothetical protein OIU85_014114 [Salix viminalis]